MASSDSETCTWRAALPNETWHAILAALPPSTLLQATLVSRQCHAVADRLLYASIAILDAAPHPTRTAALAATLLARPALAAYPRRLHIRWHAADPSTAQATLAALAAVLPLLTELDSLDLLLHHSPTRLPPALLLPCRFPLLSSLSLSGLAPPSPSVPSGPPDPLATFLAAHPTLTHLRLCDNPHALPLPAPALPLLAAFTGSPATAAALLPGRPVAALTLLGAHPEFVAPADLAAIADAPLRLLDLSFMSVTPALLRDVSKHLTQLQVLRVRLALRHTLHFALSGIALLTALTRVLGAFPSLIELDLSPTESVGRAQPAEEHSLCATYARACPSLARVVFPSKMEWVFLSKEEIWVSRYL